MELKEKITSNKKTVAPTIVVSVIILAMIAPAVADKTLLNQETITFPATANVTVPTGNNSQEVGLAAGGNNLTYGRITTENNETRFVALGAKKKTSFRLEATGNISKYLEYEKKLYYKGQRNISVEIRPDKPGYYEGKLVIKAKYPKIGLGARWLRLKR